MTSSRGVFLKSNSAKWILSPASLHLVIIFLIVYTAFSARLLDCGYVSDEVTCLIPYAFTNLANASLTNCGPLSLIKVSIMPYLAILALMCLITVIDFVSFCNGATSMKFE